MIPDSFKQDLLNRVDIVDVIERYVPLKKAGSNLSACCPFHNEKTPSFSVSPSKQFYHCFGCQAHGNAIGFLMEYQGIGYVEAVKDLAESVGMKLPDFEPQKQKADAGPDLYAIVEKAALFYREQLKDSPKAIDYLKGRGLTGKIAARFGIGYAPDGWQGLQAVFSDYADKALKDAGLVIDSEEGRRYDRFRDRIMFPILNQRGSVIGFGGRVMGEGEPKYLNSPETPLFEKGRELYGFSQARRAIRESGRVVVVEGYMDVVALAQHGVEYAVATLGTATTPVHVSKLLRNTDELVFCFDGDAAGRRAAWHALEVSLPLLADHKVIRFLFLPPEDDPDSYIRAHGREAFEQKLAGARPLSTFLMTELGSRVDMDSIEGRSKLVHEARPLLQKIAAPAMQLQLLKELGELSRMSADEVMRLCGIQAVVAPPPPRTAPSARLDERDRSFPRQREARPRGGPMDRTALLNEQQRLRKLLQCLIAKPVLAEDISLDGLEDGPAEARSLVALARFLREHPEAPSALIIEHFQNSEHELVIRDALLELDESGLAGADLEAEFRGYQGHDALNLLTARMAELMQKADTVDGMSAEEKTELSRLYQELNVLKSRSNDSPTVV